MSEYTYLCRTMDIATAPGGPTAIPTLDNVDIHDIFSESLYRSSYDDVVRKRRGGDERLARGRVPRPEDPADFSELAPPHQNITMGQTGSTSAGSALVERQTPPANPHSHASGPPPPGCPMHASAPPPQPALAQCPVPHDSNAINPHNNMPVLGLNRAPGQVLDLPLERTISSIPRTAGSTYGPAGPASGAAQPNEAPSKWEYPSPQQFYNALVRKGWETPEEHVETMVHIHNFLNEEAWIEVLKWEARREGGPEEAVNLELARFQGRPGQLSPKAHIMQLAGWLLPSRFSSDPPFDRHDWVVRRPKTGEEVRYVIDYYSSEHDENGQPIFYLDVRPALDNFDSLKTRISAATSEAWAAFRQANSGSNSTGAPQAS